MKIVILHTDFRIYWPPRLKSFYAFLKEKGHELTVIEIAGKGSPYSFAEHSDLSVFPGWKILFPEHRIEDVSPKLANRAVYKTLDELDPDVLLSGALAYYSGAAATRWAGNKNKPLVIFDNARLEDVQRNLVVNVYKKQLYKLADAIFCPAPSLDYSYQFWGFPKSAIFYGLNCVDNQFFGNAAGIKQAALPKKYFLCIGRQVKKKNITGLLYAYKQYVAQTIASPIPLVLVGDGPEHQLLKLIAAPLTGELVHFLPFQTQEQLIPILKGCTVYILPSLYGETWGLTVNEAMACEKPVVVSAQCGCCSTLVKPGENGWVFNPHETGKLISLLLEIGQLTENNLITMGKKSGEIIQNWGLEKFNSGMWAAIEYTVAKSKKRNKKNKPIPRILSHFWKGRFRPEMPLNSDHIKPIEKITFLHTDLRLYWNARLKELQFILGKIGIKLDIIEIAGKGSPYSFEETSRKIHNWHVLFPCHGPEDLTSNKSHKKIKDKLAELDPDILIAGALAFHSGSAALKWKAKTNRPIIIFDDARQVDVKRNYLVNFIKKTFYKNVDALICPAPSHKDSYVKWNVESERIFYGIDVVDNKFFFPNNIHQRNHNSTILAIGRHIEAKNWDIVIKEFLRYKENKVSDIKLVFIGNGPLNNYLKELSMGCNDIHFVPFISQENLLFYYHNAKAVILPSKKETWGLVVNEAMAAGVPVLVSRNCGCAETLVSEGINGWTFQPENGSQIFNILQRIDELDLQSWREMSKASLNIIKEWDLSRFGREILDAIVYAKTNPKLGIPILNRAFIKMWNGRYRII